MRNSLAARTLISTPRAGASLTKASIERTTPLICGSQASVMMRMRVNGKAGTGMLGRMWTLRDWTGLATCRLVTPPLSGGLNLLATHCLAGLEKPQLRPVILNGHPPLRRAGGNY